MRVEPSWMGLMPLQEETGEELASSLSAMWGYNEKDMGKAERVPSPDTESVGALILVGFLSLQNSEK